MNSIKKTTVVMLAIAFALNSCTIEKRKHLAGYHMEWNRTANNTTKAQIIKPTKSLEQFQLITIAQPVNDLKIKTKDDCENLIASSNTKQIVLRKATGKQIHVTEQNQLVKNRMLKSMLAEEPVKVTKASTANAAGAKTTGTRGKGIFLKLFSLLGIGFILIKINKALSKNKNNNAPEKKKTQAWVWVLMGIALLLGAGALIMTLGML